MRRGQRAIRLVLIAAIILPAICLARAAQKNRTLMVAGHPGELAVVEMEGRFYIEIAALARLLNASLSFDGNQTILTLPAAASDTSAQARPTSEAPGSGFSKEFIRAGIEEMTAIREWRIALANALQAGFPGAIQWVDNFRVQAQQNLRLASLAASTEADRNAFQLLTNEFNNMKKLSEKYIEIYKARTYIAPDALNNDPLNQKIFKCAQSMAAMAASGQFVDDVSCH